jgi:hypothetical protein
VRLFPLLVGKHLVGLVHFQETPAGLGVAATVAWVELEGQGTVGKLDIFEGGLSR